MAHSDMGSFYYTRNPNDFEAIGITCVIFDDIVERDIMDIEAQLTQVKRQKKAFLFNTFLFPFYFLAYLLTFRWFKLRILFSYEGIALRKLFTSNKVLIKDFYDSKLHVPNKKQKYTFSFL